MKLYEVTISPRAGFGTPLKGDTLFGHFCWQAAYDPSLLNGDLGDLIAAYPEKPFVIFSSAFPRLGNAAGRYYFKRPDLPLRRLTSLGGKDRKEKIKAEKAHNKKKWMEITGGPGLIDPLKVNFVTDKDLVKSAFSGMDVNARARAQHAGAREYSMVFSHPHNSINRLTQKTGAAPFTPYNQRVTHYYPDAELVIFILVDDSATDIQKVAKALERIGAWGFGRNATTGMGRFTVGKPGPIAFPKNPDANACYALAPSVAGKEAFEEIYFKTFVRYGKHGDRLARSGRPFKNPVIMADEGAVYIPREPSFFNKPYLGAAVTGVSKSMPETVVQGYAPYLPMKLEQRNETIPG